MLRMATCTVMDSVSSSKRPKRRLICGVITAITLPNRMMVSGGVQPYSNTRMRCEPSAPAVSATTRRSAPATHQRAIRVARASHVRRMIIPVVSGRSRNKRMSSAILRAGSSNPAGMWAPARRPRMIGTVSTLAAVVAAVIDTESATFPRPSRVNRLEKAAGGALAMRSSPSVHPAGRSSARASPAAASGTTSHCKPSASATLPGFRARATKSRGLRVAPMPVMMRTSWVGISTRSTVGYHSTIRRDCPCLPHLIASDVQIRGTSRA